MQTVNALRDRIVSDFKKAWEVNDGAHRVGHFADVEECGLLINTKLGLGYDPKLIMLVAYFHDLFSWSRNNHHLMAAEWIMTTNYPIIAVLTEEERKLVAAGCREHRASGTGEFSCEFAELMCSADRGIPSPDPSGLLIRSFRYHLDHGMDTGGALKHIKEKFGTGGYARFPWLYELSFKDTLQAQREAVDAL